MFRVHTSVDITVEQVSDLFITAIEGGSIWMTGIRLISTEIPHTHPWYADPGVYGSPFLFSLAVDGEEQQSKKLMGLANIIRGLQTMADKSPEHFANIVSDHRYDETADVFMQYVVFNEIIYG